ncbi:hypothetical protein [Streptomyces sp. H39-C1]|uniref:hypothetical protein n=1 Tax=Streptomyces sp. H39-C1 TaxID=3004355 RepID=UPI0022AEA11C|nr:hypothetical protein [Streptomyces sp. H39-C1]MCZ4098064.1 hypothetical protein [Streptomyces sp. H39-C1]
MTVINKAGFLREFDFAELPAPEPMQRSLAKAFAGQSRHWTSHASAETYWNDLLAFMRFLASQEQAPDDLDGLTGAMMKRWRQRNIGSGRHALGSTRVLLRRDTRLASGPVAEELARRVPRTKPSKQSYGEAERERVLLTARRQFRTAWMRIRENTELLERWRAGDLPEGSREWRIGEILEFLAHNGDVPRTRRPDGRTSVKSARLLGGEGVARTWGRLFLTQNEATALGVLLTDRFAWNLSLYHRLPAPTTAPSAGETKAVTYHVQLEKRRAGGGRWFSTENITDSGADSPGRLISQALEATVHGRALAARLIPGTDLLITSRTSVQGRQSGDLDRPRPIGPLRFGISSADARAWARSHKLGGSPFQRTRRSTVVEEGRPLQHTQQTHQSTYVLPDKRVQSASREVFEEGALEALGMARAIAFGGQLADAPSPSHQETATADCADESSSPWPTSSGGCGADFLLCLACRNAHVHPGHHARLAYLHQQLDSMRSVMPDNLWNSRWRNHLLRLEDLREKVSPAAWDAALTRVSDTDRALVRLLLKEDLAP